MTLWQHIKWCIAAVEPVPESDCAGPELWLVAVVIAACTFAMIGA